MHRRAIRLAVRAFQVCAFPALLLALVLFACAGGESSPPSPADDGNVAGDAPPYGGGTSVIPSSSYDDEGGSGSGSSDGGAFHSSGLTPCPRDATMDGSEETATVLEADVDGSAVFVEGSDVGAACPGSLAPGDLVVDELMIASQSGVGDHGEWVEVASTRGCALDLNGLFAQVPHGKGSTIASITTDLWLPPHGFFLIADSAEPAENHSLPGMLVTWGSGTSSDVLKNSGTRSPCTPQTPRLTCSRIRQARSWLTEPRWLSRRIAIRACAPSSATGNPPWPPGLLASTAHPPQRTPM